MHFPDRGGLRKVVWCDPQTEGNGVPKTAPRNPGVSFTATVAVAFRLCVTPNKFSQPTVVRKMHHTSQGRRHGVRRYSRLFVDH